MEPLDFTKQDVVRPLDKALKNTGHITILRGNLAPDSAVAKLTGKEGLKFEVRTACGWFAIHKAESDDHTGHGQVL